MAQIILDSNNNLIQGDFDNATLNNRTKLQTTTTNATTNVYVVPNGSSTSAGVSVANNSSLTNASKIVMATNGTTDTQIISGVNGSGSYLPLSFYTNNALAMQLSTAGNLAVTGGITVGATAAPAFGAYGPAGTTQALTSNVTAKVQINTENFDTNSNYDTGTYRFTPTVAGYYQITGQVYFSGTGITQASARIYKNGSLIRTGTPVLCSSVTDIVALVSTVLYMNGSTDYIELYARGTFSGATAVSGAETDTYFQAFLARSA
jgi:hypothetical protein